MQSHSFIVCVVLAVSAILSTPRGFGQTPAPATSSSIPTTPTILHANANLVLVDVIVTDKGKAIHSLDRGSFHVFEDGREQAISTFDEHHPAATPLTPNRIKLPPHTYSNIPVYPDAGVVNVLLLDGLNTPAANQMDMRRQMIEYLGKVQPGTTLAIFTLASELRLVEGFTTDPSQLAKAIASSKGNPSVLLDPASAQSLDEATDDMINAYTTAEAVASMRQFAADVGAYQMDVRVRMTLDGLKDLARYLSSIPGRKNLIWFSGSFPIALDPDDTLRSPFNAMRNYSEDIRETNDLLSAARVAVYPVDARGLLSGPSVEASYKSRGNPATAGANFARDTARFMASTLNEQATMQQVAEQTGGQEYVNTNGLKEAVANAIENGSSYYIVGYIPANSKFDGQFHKIQVHLDNSTYKLAYRRGYYADARDKALAQASGRPNLLVEAALHGAPPATQILFQARILPASDPLLKGLNLPAAPAGAMAASLKAPTARYVAQMTVDPRHFTYEENPDGTRKVSIEFAALAYDADGKRINYYDRPIQLSLKPEQYTRLMATGIPATIALDLPAGQIFLRLVVVDQAAGHAGSLEIPVTVKAP